MKALPSVNVFVLNYNGRKYLRARFESLAAVDYPADRFLAVLVDNNSTDGSTELVQREFPRVEVCRSVVNRGFGDGNNFGVSQFPDADVYVFLNADVVVDRHWLANGVAALASDDKIGVLSSKSLFFSRYLCLRVTPSLLGKLSLTGLRCENFRLHGEKLRCRGMELQDAPIPKWTLASEAMIQIPLAESQPLLSAGAQRLLSFSVGNPTTEMQMVAVRDEIRQCDIVEKWTLCPGQQRELTIAVTDDMAGDLVQNAGSYAHQNGECGDRGFWDIDRGQYNLPCDVDAACGVAMFVRRNVFEQLHGFDSRYFMYYEDVDLSLRADARVAGRLRADGENPPRPYGIVGGMVAFFQASGGPFAFDLRHEIPAAEACLGDLAPSCRGRGASVCCIPHRAVVQQGAFSARAAGYRIPGGNPRHSRGEKSIGPKSVLSSVATHQRDAHPSVVVFFRLQLTNIGRMR